jgi:hypothetical protein
VLEEFACVLQESAGTLLRGFPAEMKDLVAGVHALGRPALHIGQSVPDPVRRER